MGEDARKLPSVPPDKVTSSTVKFVVGSDALKNTMIDLSLVVAPSGIGFVPSLAVIVMEGAILSRLQVNWFDTALLLPAVSVNLLAATLTAVTLLLEGVSVAV